MSRELQPCGTNAAYKRHRQLREQACDECLLAHHEYVKSNLGSRIARYATNRTNLEMARRHPDVYQAARRRAHAAGGTEGAVRYAGFRAVRDAFYDEYLDVRDEIRERVRAELGWRREAARGRDAA